MCKRLSLTEINKEILSKRFSLRAVPDLEPMYNLGPNQLMYIIRNDFPDMLTPAQWGLKLFYDRAFALETTPAEEVMKNPEVSKCFNDKRCLIVVDSFYDWKDNVAYRITMPDKSLFAIAGIWDNKEYLSFGIITTKANKDIKDINNRMPVIIPKNLERQWLLGSVDDAHTDLAPYEGKLNVQKVSKDVMDATNNSIDVTKTIN
jgi:putative SOS response-associated peptidase YedK|tara:strand:- start:62 stop:673 length:612 start_codon:yes stop_codon:yes gene_type:complete